MERTYLTDDDIKYIGCISVWVRGALEFSILNVPPRCDDLVFIERELPHLFCGSISQTFALLGELTEICEELASNKMIYEAWLYSAFENISLVARALSEVDGNRLIAYFLERNDVSDISGLANEAQEAIDEARHELYG